MQGHRSCVREEGDRTDENETRARHSGPAAGVYHRVGGCTWFCATGFFSASRISCFSFWFRCTKKITQKKNFTPSHPPPQQQEGAAQLIVPFCAGWTVRARAVWPSRSARFRVPSDQPATSPDRHGLPPGNTSVDARRPSCVPPHVFHPASCFQVAVRLFHQSKCVFCFALELEIFGTGALDRRCHLAVPTARHSDFWRRTRRQIATQNG